MKFAHGNFHFDVKAFGVSDGRALEVRTVPYRTAVLRIIDGIVGIDDEVIELCGCFHGVGNNHFHAVVVPQGIVVPGKLSRQRLRGSAEKFHGHDLFVAGDPDPSGIFRLASVFADEQFRLDRLGKTANGFSCFGGIRFPSLQLLAAGCFPHGAIEMREDVLDKRGFRVPDNIIGVGENNCSLAVDIFLNDPDHLAVPALDEGREARVGEIAELPDRGELPGRFRRIEETFVVGCRQNPRNRRFTLTGYGIQIVFQCGEAHAQIREELPHGFGTASKRRPAAGAEIENPALGQNTAHGFAYRGRRKDFLCRIDLGKSREEDEFRVVQRFAKTQRLFIGELFLRSDLERIYLNRIGIKFQLRCVADNGHLLLRVQHKTADGKKQCGKEFYHLPFPALILFVVLVRSFFHLTPQTVRFFPGGPV